MKVKVPRMSSSKSFILASSIIFSCLTFYNEILEIQFHGANGPALFLFFSWVFNFLEILNIAFLSKCLKLEKRR